MGQTLPLPQRVPIPTKQQATKLATYGIKVDPPSRDGSRYEEIHLPDGYLMHNNSLEPDTTIWYILRSGTNKAIAEITGVWSDATGDKKLQMTVYDSEKEVEIQMQPMTTGKSYTSNLKSTDGKRTAGFIGLSITYGDK